VLMRCKRLQWELIFPVASLHLCAGAHVTYQQEQLVSAEVGAWGSVGRMMRAEQHAARPREHQDAAGAHEDHAVDLAEYKGAGSKSARKHQEAAVDHAEHKGAGSKSARKDQEPAVDHAEHKGAGSKSAHKHQESAEDLAKAKGSGSKGAHEGQGAAVDREEHKGSGGKDLASAAVDLAEHRAAGGGGAEGQAGAGSDDSVDCEWGDWGAYSACSVSCGWGETSRTRVITVQQRDHGRPCIGQNQEKKACKYLNCPVACKWGDWGQWTNCSKTCGGGGAERARAKAELAQFGGRDCVGSDMESQTCNTQACATTCQWASWSDWSECSKSCGGGVSARARGVGRRAENGGPNCSGSWIENVTCGTKLCPVNCLWGNWEGWGTCSKSCGNGTTMRIRGKKVTAANGGKDCDGVDRQVTSCNAISCPTDCKWAVWSDWSACSKTCGRGERSHSRGRLVNASHGGRDCLGNASASEACSTAPCHADCRWETWGNWSSCTRTCGGGSQARERVSVPARFGGRPCQGSAREEGTCNTAGCAVECKWSPWSSWENCTASCGGGVTNRKRYVTQQAAWGGLPCTGGNSEQDACNVQGCAVDCRWTEWESWTPCSKTCGAGLRSRSRAEIVKAAFGGRPCFGSNADNGTCNTKGCPVDCAWGEWSSWTPCTVTCGNGSTTRLRAQETTQVNGGQACTGESHAVSACNTDPCPIDCEWGGWESWTRCTATCGGGMSSRSRSKVKQARNGGRDCIGESGLEKECNAQPCPVDCKWEDWGAWSECSVTCGMGVRRRARPKLEEQYGGTSCSGPGTEDGQCSREGPNCPTASMTPAPSPVPVPATPAPSPGPPCNETSQNNSAGGNAVVSSSRNAASSSGNAASSSGNAASSSGNAGISSSIYSPVRASASASFTASPSERGTVAAMAPAAAAMAPAASTQAQTGESTTTTTEAGQKSGSTTRAGMVGLAMTPAIVATAWAVLAAWPLDGAGV